MHLAVTPGPNWYWLLPHQVARTVQLQFFPPQMVVATSLCLS